MEDTLGAADRSPFREGGREAVLWPNDLPKQGGRPRRLRESKLAWELEA